MGTGGDERVGWKHMFKTIITTDFILTSKCSKTFGAPGPDGGA